MIYTLPVIVYLAPTGRLAYSGLRDRRKALYNNAVTKTCVGLPFSDSLISRRIEGDFSIH